MSLVTIDGSIKAMRTTLRVDANKEPLVMGQVVIEFPVDSYGTEVIKNLAPMLDSPVRCQITDIQTELPLKVAGR
jgi:hypothetical protein